MASPGLAPALEGSTHEVGVGRAVTARGRQRAVFLDRDGTLNRAYVRGGVSVPPSCVEEFELLPGVEEAVDQLRRADFKLVVVSNQPDVARGTQVRANVDGINAALESQLPVDAVFCCFHDDSDGCGCRKPEPGLCLEAATRLEIDLSRSFVVGDSWRDVEAGRRAGCTTVLLRVPYAVQRGHDPDFEADDLLEAAAIILRCSEEDQPT